MVTILCFGDSLDAVADGDRIWGLIRGSAVVQEGVSKSLGTPTVHCESLAMALALEDAGVEGHQVSFVEMHGTGTPVGDPLEVMAVEKVSLIYFAKTAVCQWQEVNNTAYFPSRCIRKRERVHW